MWNEQYHIYVSTTMLSIFQTTMISAMSSQPGHTNVHFALESKNAVCAFQLHANYFLLPWKISDWN